MFRLVLKYTKGFTLAAIMAPLLVTGEVIMGSLIPRIMSQIIDQGINGPGGSNLELIYQLGGTMVFYSVLSMFFGAASGICSAIALINIEVKEQIKRLIQYMAGTRSKICSL